MESAAEIAIGVFVELFLAAIALGVLYRFFGHLLNLPQRQKVLFFQKGVVLQDGQVTRVLKPGNYWIRPSRTLILCDMRSKPFQITAQELLTADGMGVRISLGGEYRVAAPESFVVESSDAFGALYLDLRQALRTAAIEQNGDALLGENTLLLMRVKELIVPRSKQLGIELVQLDIWEIVPLGWLRQN